MLSYMHPELVDTPDERVPQVVINWPRLVVDALEADRPPDLRLGGQPEVDEALNHVAQYNDLDPGDQQAHEQSAHTGAARNHRRRPARYWLFSLGLA
jgi:hypothetical protein